MKLVAKLLGCIFVLLGGLWLLQGLGIVHLRPILCFADCVTIQGSSPTWVVIGAVTLAIGGLFIASSFRRLRCQFENATR